MKVSDKLHYQTKLLSILKKETTNHGYKFSAKCYLPTILDTPDT